MNLKRGGVEERGTLQPKSRRQQLRHCYLQTSGMNLPTRLDGGSGTFQTSNKPFIDSLVKNWMVFGRFGMERSLFQEMETNFMLLSGLLRTYQPMKNLMVNYFPAVVNSIPLLVLSKVKILATDGNLSNTRFLISLLRR